MSAGAKGARSQRNVNHPDLRFSKHGAFPAPVKHWTGMSRVRTQFSEHRHARRLRLLLVATSMVALMSGGAQAQLRTELPVFDDPYATVDPNAVAPEADATNGGRARTRQGAQNPPTAPVPGYRPVSPGAIGDTASGGVGAVGAGGITDPTGADLGASAPVPTRRPSTARARAEARAALASPPTSVPVALDPEARATADAELDSEYMTGTVGEPQDDADYVLPIGERSLREQAIEGLTPPPDENPFAAPGIRVGSFILRPSLEQGVTATSNADSSVDGESAVLSETTLRLNAVSDWSRHSASLDAYGIFRKSLSGEELEETEAGVDAALNLDLSDDLRALGTLGYARRPDSASSAVVISGVESQPLLQTFNASAGLSKDVGKMRFGVTGRVERNDYGDADLLDGTVLSQEDRNSTLATVTLRGGYEISPALTPFAEVEIGQRRYDQEIDSAGYARSSDRLGARAGVALDLDQKLVGELSGGWIREAFDDDRLSDVAGASLNADLRWSVERGTTLALAAATTVEGTTTPGESGSLLHAGTLTLEREIRANLTANAAVGAGYRNFTDSDGHDTLFNAQVGATWWLNRYAGLTGRLRYETLRSNLPGRDYDTSSAFLGLRLQR